MPLVLVSDAAALPAADGVIRVLRRADEVVHVVREETPEGGVRVTAYGPGNTLAPLPSPEGLPEPAAARSASGQAHVA